MTLPPRTAVCSERTNALSPEVQVYLLGCLTHPDPGSEFDQMLSRSRLLELPEEERIQKLLQAGYLALLYLQGEEIIGHAFLQRHGSELHLFSLEIGPSYRGRDLGWAVALDLIAFARETAGIRRLRLSKGEHGYFAEYLIPRLVEEQAKHRLSIDAPSGFVTLVA